MVLGSARCGGVGQERARRVGRVVYLSWVGRCGPMFKLWTGAGTVGAGRRCGPMVWPGSGLVVRAGGCGPGPTVWSEGAGQRAWAGSGLVVRAGGRGLGLVWWCGPEVWPGSGRKVRAGGRGPGQVGWCGPVGVGWVWSGGAGRWVPVWAGSSRVVRAGGLGSGCGPVGVGRGLVGWCGPGMSRAGQARAGRSRAGYGPKPLRRECVKAGGPGSRGATERPGAEGRARLLGASTGARASNSGQRGCSSSRCTYGVRRAKRWAWCGWGGPWGGRVKWAGPGPGSRGGAIYGPRRKATV